MKVRPMTSREKNNLLRWRSKRAKKNGFQKFQRGDIVYLHKNQGPGRSHFESDEYAVILGSYRDLYGGTDTKDYSVWHLKEGYESCWYPEDRMTEVKT